MVADRYRTNHRVETVGSDDFGLVDLLAHLAVFLLVAALGPAGLQVVHHAL
eukprot:gene47326-57970_t